MRAFILSIILIFSLNINSYAAVFDVRLQFSDFFLMDLRRGTTPPPIPPFEVIDLSFRIDFQTPAILDEVLNVNFISVIDTNFPFDGALTYISDTAFDPSGSTIPLIGSTVNGVQTFGDRDFLTTDFIITGLRFDGVDITSISPLAYQVAGLGARYESGTQSLLGLQPVTPIPLPANALLLLTALFGLAAFAVRSRGRRYLATSPESS